MRYLIGSVVIFAVTFLAYAIDTYISKWGSLEGEIVFDVVQGETVFAPEDSMYVFLVAPQIGPFLDSLKSYYTREIKVLEDTVEILRGDVEYYTQRAREEQLIFYTSFNNEDPSTRLYRESKQYLDQVIGEKEKIEKLFQQKRLKLIDEQSGYNGVILELLNNKMELKAAVDVDGSFSFPKITNGPHYVYALRILSGNKDITKVPVEMIHIYALSGEKFKRYSWMVMVDVDEDTYIRLDSSNTSQIFK